MQHWYQRLAHEKCPICGDRLFIQERDHYGNVDGVECSECDFSIYVPANGTIEENFHQIKNGDKSLTDYKIEQAERSLKWAEQGVIDYTNRLAELKEQKSNETPKQSQG